MIVIKRKMLFFFFFLFLIILISGCIENPFKEVPVVKVSITFLEKEGIAEAENYTLIQGYVTYFNRPRLTVAEKFPAIAGRTTISKGKNSTIGPWETLAYNGNGTYSFNLGFRENHYPTYNDIIHISIMVVDEKGKKIGYIVDDIIWK